jgi:hypothetical protein
MSMINGAYLVKVRDQDGERFMVVYNDPDKQARAGYIWSTTDELTEADVRRQMPDDADRILAAARSSFEHSQSKS